MNELTRREFMHDVVGAAVGHSVAGRDAILRVGSAAPPFVSPGRSNAPQNSAASPLKSLIFPEPQEMSSSGSDFALDNQVPVIVPSNASDENLFLAGSLVHELSDRFGQHLKIERGTTVNPRQRAILMGSVENPLVKQYCTQMNLLANMQEYGEEGYVLHTDSKLAMVCGNSDRGAFHGFQSLRQLIANEEGQIRFRGVQVRDWPDKPFRGIYLFLPGRDNIPFFKRFVRDFMALYKYNTLIMEMNACMRLDGHPELNYGSVQFARDVNYSCRNYPRGPFHDMEQNSSHQDVADGGILEKEEVADLARWVRRHHIELVPVASFFHA